MFSRKFVTITRTIDPGTGIHYLDAIDEYGLHWTAQMSHKIESYLCYTELWHRDPQQPKSADICTATHHTGPTSHVKQALADLAAVYNADKIDDTTYENIRRALQERLDG